MFKLEIVPWHGSSVNAAVILDDHGICYYPHIEKRVQGILTLGFNSSDEGFEEGFQ